MGAPLRGFFSGGTPLAPPKTRRHPRSRPRVHERARTAHGSEPPRLARSLLSRTQAPAPESRPPTAHRRSPRSGRRRKIDDCRIRRCSAGDGIWPHCRRTDCGCRNRHHRPSYWDTCRSFFRRNNESQKQAQEFDKLIPDRRKRLTLDGCWGSKPSSDQSRPMSQLRTRTKPLSR